MMREKKGTWLSGTLEYIQISVGHVQSDFHRYRFATYSYRRRKASLNVLSKSHIHCHLIDLF